MSLAARLRSALGRRPRWLRVLALFWALQAVSGHAAANGAPPAGSEVVLYALTLLGTPYRYGGNDPASGFDCSGFVRYVFGRTLDLQLPRRSEDIRKVGARASIEALQPGDLVFFNTLGQPWSHVAIALGDGQFVHAPARGGRVRIERLSDPYWSKRFNGARRLDLAAGRTLVEEAVARRAPLPVDNVIDNPPVTP